MGRDYLGGCHMTPGSLKTLDQQQDHGAAAAAARAAAAVRAAAAKASSRQPAKQTHISSSVSQQQLWASKPVQIGGVLSSEQDLDRTACLTPLLGMLLKRKKNVDSHTYFHEIPLIFLTVFPTEHTQENTEEVKDVRRRD